MVTNQPIRLPLHAPRSWGRGGSRPSDAWSHCVRQGETDTGEEVFEVERTFCVLFPSPNKTQGTLPSRGTVHGLFWFSARSFGVRCQSWAIANMREESDARTEGAEMTTSPPSSSVLLAPAYACTYRPWLALSICTYGVAICSCGVTVPINRHGFAIRFCAS